VIRPVLVLALLAAVLAGCGGPRAGSPERVVREWSSALNASDNERAANLFAHDARVIQGGVVISFHTHAEALAWNRSLPCSGRIVGLERHGADVTATFELGDRKESVCDGPGMTARALFRVEHGKIVIWHQLAARPGTGGAQV
jgi:limonene-1,2-epoxide hydrolase